MDGSVRGRSDDLSHIESLADMAFKGQAAIEVDLAKKGSHQDVRLKLDGKNIESPFGSVQSMNVRAGFQNILKSPEGSAELRLHEFRREDLHVSDASLNIKGNVKGNAKGRNGLVTFSGKSGGQYNEPFEMECKGGLEWSATEKRLKLDRLEANYGGIPIVLENPLTVLQKNRMFSVKNAAFRLDSGALKGFCTYDPEKISLDARLDDLPLKILQTFDFPQLEGTVSGSIHASGPTDDPKAAVDMEARNLRFADGVLGELNPATLKARSEFNNGLATANLSITGPTEDPIEAELRLPVEISVSSPSFRPVKNGELRGRLKGAVDLGILPELLNSEDHIFHGSVNVDLSAGNTVEAPKLSGDLRLDGGSYENLKSGTLLKDVHLHVNVKDREIVLEQAKATDSGEGTVSATGRMDLDRSENFPFGLEVGIENARLLRRDDMTVDAGGKVELKGALNGNMALSGAVTVRRAEILIPDNSSSETAELEVIEINRPDAKKDGNKQDGKIQKTGKRSELPLDLKIDLPGKVFLRGRGIDSEWQGNLHVTGTAGDPVVKGKLSVVRGSADLLTKRFELKEGSAIFNGNRPPDPLIDVTTEYTRSGFTAKVHLTGAPSDIEIALDSDPAVPKDEILSRVLFGRSADNLSPVQALKLAQALNSLAGGGGGSLDIMDRARKLLGVDTLDAVQSDDEKGGTALSIGKYITDDVYVEAEQGLAGDSGKVSVEIELSPNLSVATEVGANSQGGIRLNWRWDY